MKLPKNILNAKIFQLPKILKSKISNPPKNVNHPCHLQSGPIRSNPLEIYSGTCVLNILVWVEEGLEVALFDINITSFLMQIMQ